MAEVNFKKFAGLRTGMGTRPASYVAVHQPPAKRCAHQENPPCNTGGLRCNSQQCCVLNPSFPSPFISSSAQRAMLGANVGAFVGRPKHPCLAAFRGRVLL